MPILVSHGLSIPTIRSDRFIQAVSALNNDGFARALSFSGYAINVDRQNLIGAWFPGEFSGASCIDNSEQQNHATACSLSVPDVGFGGIMAASFNGASAHVSIYSTAFNTDFNGNELTLFIVARAGSIGNWTDSTVRNLLHLAVSASNDLFLTKSNTNYQLRVSYTASGATAKVVNNTLASTTIPNGFFSLAITVSATASQMIAFYNGEQYGSTQTGLLNWSGALSNALSVIGANAVTGTNPWIGWIGATLVWKKALEPNTIRNLHRYTGAGV